jgi:hypothetical protein
MSDNLTFTAFQVFPVAGFAQPLFAVHDQLAAQENLFGVADQLPAFVETVIRPLVGMRHTVFHALFGIPNHDVRICAGDERSLARIQAEDFGGVRGHIIDSG